MKTYKLIKETVEFVSGIKALDFPNRKRYVSDCRKVYFGLSRFYLKQAYHNSNCSLVMKRDHSSGLHNSKQFENLHRTKKFKANEVYDKCRAILDPILLHKTLEVDDEIEFAYSRIEYLKVSLESLIKELSILELRRIGKLEVEYELVTS